MPKPNTLNVQVTQSARIGRDGDSQGRGRVRDSPLARSQHCFTQPCSNPKSKDFIFFARNRCPFPGFTYCPQNEAIPQSETPLDPTQQRDHGHHHRGELSCGIPTGSPRSKGPHLAIRTRVPAQLGARVPPMSLPPQGALGLEVPVPFLTPRHLQDFAGAAETKRRRWGDNGHFLSLSFRAASARSLCQVPRGTCQGRS